MASALDKKLKEMKDALDKATQCSFGRACSADDAEQTEGPNAGRNLTDAEKAELGELAQEQVHRHRRKMILSNKMKNL